MTTNPRLMVVGAHPDDAEFNASGLMLRYADAGYAIAILSLTDGSAGHQTLDRKQLAERRLKEAENSAVQLGAELSIWGNPDGALEPSLANRERLIQDVRLFAPDLLVTHRLQDYHPDHRATAQLVQDACYMVRVPNVVPEVPALQNDVVVLQMCDFFAQPQPFVPDLVLPLDNYFDRACALLAYHESQVNEWLPHMEGVANPESAQSENGGWLREVYGRRAGTIARRFGQGQCNLAEAFQLSEYGRRVDEETLAALCLREPISI